MFTENLNPLVKVTITNVNTCFVSFSTLLLLNHSLQSGYAYKEILGLSLGSKHFYNKAFFKCILLDSYDGFVNP
jgi:hypothetical protein